MIDDIVCNDAVIVNRHFRKLENFNAHATPLEKRCIGQPGPAQCFSTANASRLFGILRNSEAVGSGFKL
jgi:hypothetical protein